MFWVKKLLVFWCLKLSFVLADDIGEDYFLETPLRSITANPDICHPQKNMYCKHRCQNHEGICFKKKCYCIYELKLTEWNEEKYLVPSTIPPLNEKSDSSNNDLTLQPQLRHHIAHFCPNLDEARKCIRKCMKEGTPAFCGKDHICYCGHRYSNHQKEKRLDPAKVKVGFYDLYQKYFGSDNI